MTAEPATPHGAAKTGWWRTAIPFAVAIGLALMAPPAGLPQHAWYYFALFTGVIAALVTEPLPNAAMGLLGITAAAVLSPFVLFAPAELAKPGFNVAGSAASWALSGFSSTTVWLVGGAFMFAMGYEKTGLGRRIALVLVRSLGGNTLSLGYAATAAETVLAIFTPSNTARGAGTVYPVVSNLPALYDSKPDDPSSRRIGSYVLYTAFAANTITSSLFVTGCAPNFLALNFARTMAKVEISWWGWFAAAAPFAVPLLLAMPLLVFLIYPPEIKRSPEVPAWANQQLQAMGALTRREIILGVLVVGAVLLWILGGNLMDPAIAAFLAVSLMLVFGVFTWNDMARNHAAWTTVVLLATLVTMAGGLARVGFIKWFADFVARHVGGFDPTLMVMLLVSVYFLSHYMFASLTAHTSAMFPVMLGVGMGIHGLPADKLALALALTTGIMGVITPYATGAALPYYNSGYIRPAAFWGLGAIFGAIFLAALLGIGVPLLMVR
jgi:L-tartrate/succinate antiporter